MEIIANPHSGKSTGMDTVQQVKAYLDSRNIPYTLHLTQEQGHGQYLARELCRQGAEVIVAIGGDGTFHEALNGMDFTRSRLGFIQAEETTTPAVPASAAVRWRPWPPL